MLTTFKSDTLHQKATVSWSSFYETVLDYLNKQSGTTWRKIFAPLIRGVVTAHVERWAIDLGIRFDVQNLFARDWFNTYQYKFWKQIGQTTKDAISEIMNMAQREGWSIPTMQNRLTDLYSQWAKGDKKPDDFDWLGKRMPPYRTEMIARTETIRASNAGTVDQFKAWGVARHEWLATDDDRTRRISEGDEFDHMAMNRVVTQIDIPFQVPMKDGGTEPLMFPGDPDGSAANTINCRCTLIPVVEGWDEL